MRSVLLFPVWRYDIHSVTVLEKRECNPNRSDLTIVLFLEEINLKYNTNEIEHLSFSHFLASKFRN